MILLDSNIPMYVIGAGHPHKVLAQRLLESAIMRQEPLVTDAEVLQEILHRYHAIGRTEAIQPAFDLLLGVTEEVLPIQVTTLQRAKEIMSAHAGLRARDAVHLAVMDEHDIDRLMSFDSGFDVRRDIVRLC